MLYPKQGGRSEIDEHESSKQIIGRLSRSVHGEQASRGVRESMRSRNLAQLNMLFVVSNQQQNEHLKGVKRFQSTLQ